MASVGREPEGKAKGIEKAITDPKDVAITPGIGWSVTDAKTASNSKIEGTVTEPKK